MRAVVFDMAFMWLLSSSLRDLSRKSLWLFAFKLIHPEGLDTNNEALCAASVMKQISRLSLVEAQSRLPLFAPLQQVLVKASGKSF